MNEFFWSKNNFFQKSSSTGTDGGGRSFLKNSSQQRWRKNFQEIYSTRSRKFFVNFDSFSINIFQKSKNPIDKDEEKIDFQNQVKAHVQKYFFSLKKSKHFQRQEIKILKIFLKNFLKIKSFQNYNKDQEFKKTFFWKNFDFFSTTYLILQFFTKFFKKFSKISFANILFQSSI